MDRTTQRITSSQDLGRILARARRAKDLSQRQVAARLGVTQKWISNVEQGKSRAWIDKVLELAHFLDVQVLAIESSEVAAPGDGQEVGEPTMDDILKELGNG